jgi:hypothetical protein
MSWKIPAGLVTDAEFSVIGPNIAVARVAWKLVAPIELKDAPKDNRSLTVSFVSVPTAKERARLAY